MCLRATQGYFSGRWAKWVLIYCTIVALSIAKPKVMIEIMETVSPEVIAVNVRGTVTLDEYQNVSPLIYGKIAALGKAPLMVTFKDINATESKDIWGGIKHDLQKHVNDFTRVAVVVNGLKYKMLMQMARPFIPVEMKVFDEGKENEALKWIMG